MLPRWLLVLLIVSVLGVVAAVPLAIIGYASLGVVAGAAIVLVLIAPQVPLMRYVTKRTGADKDE